MKESSVQKAPVAVPLGLLILLVTGCSQEKGVSGGIKSEVPFRKQNGWWDASKGVK